MSEENSSLLPQAEGRASVDNASNPWPGLASYTEDQRHLFFGRTAEINEVVRLVGRETLTVLFGRSGLGKSSLLRAGVMPRLREQGYFPVTLRLDFSERAEVSPIEQIKALTLAAARAEGVEPEGVPENEATLTLWEWFHTVEFWGPRNDPVTPILALDQFEEVFTLGRGQTRADEFTEALADLIENRVPQSVRDRAQANGERLACDATRQDYKVILSLREDFVPRLDSLRPILPAIMRNRFALAPLTAECACAVVLGAGGKYVSEDDAREIVAAVVGGDGPLAYHPDAEVEPAYLSVMCHELFRRMQALGRSAITRDLIDAERGGILEGLYTRSFEGIGDPVRFFVEDRLLTPSGYRGTLPLADATQEGIAESDLRTLVDRRLLRFEDRLGTIHLELSHDLLTRIVLKRRESRRAEAALRVETERARKSRAAQLAQRRRSRFVAGVAIALAALLVATVWGGYYCFVQEHRASYRDVSTWRGFPLGLGELSAAQASQLPLHYVLVYKGITWDGWRPRWRPPFRFMAVDGRGNLTTNHGVGTFFWRAHDESQATELNKDRGQSLGLSAVCQWEFSSDAAGGIAYSRGLDRDGRMVWGCVYSPAASGDSAVRIAHYIGPDGFPQLQNKSAAEYIEVHYNAQGREERIYFLDAMARPAAGPDGEFGVVREYDARGNATLVTVLDERGQPMLEHQGNAALRCTYTPDGLVDEAFALGTRGQAVTTNEGWSRFKDQHDTLGRRTFTQNLDAEGRPTMRRPGYSAIRFTYDEHGSIVRETYLGVDGKPSPTTGEVVAIRRDIDDQGNETRTTFLDAADHPSRLVDGSCGYWSTYDERHNLIARRVFGPDGQPVTLPDGFAGWRSEYDASSREVRRTYQDKAGAPVLVEGGYHGYENRYDSRGNAVRYTYLGLDGKPTFASGEIAGWASEFDPRGRETVRTYFGPAGEPVIYKNGYHASAMSYDEHGYEAEITFLSLTGKPVVAGEGFATQKIQHDERGRETRRAFYDAAGKPVAHKDGYHGYLSRYDERGNVIETTTFDLSGLPAAPKAGGYAREIKTYDGHGDLSTRRYLDTVGQPVRNAAGVFGVSLRHDARANLLEETYEDQTPGKPMANNAGIVRRRYEYDAWNRTTRQATLGPGDEPVKGVDGACALVKRYDERGNWIESTWLNARGQPTTSKDGYASARYGYDDHGRCTETSRFDAAGQPCRSTDGTSRWVRRYDERGNVLRWEYFDERGRLTVGTGGYAATESEYDVRNKETRRTYLGADGKPLVQTGGFATFRQSYYPSGLERQIDYYDAHGEPVLAYSGYRAFYNEYDDAGDLRSSTWVGLPPLTAGATRTATYRDDGQERAVVYRSTDGQPANSAAGYAFKDSEYDEKGSLLRVKYRDAAGKPAYGEYGYATADRGKGVTTYSNPDGKPVRGDDIHSMRPLLYVTFLRSADSAAAQAGLQPGDVLWRAGDFSLPERVKASWDEHTDPDDARNAIRRGWKAAVSPLGDGPVHIAVLRQNRRVELDLPRIPDGGIGLNFDFRLVPASEFDAMVTRFSQPPADAATP